jgi:hypothetical protein
MTISFSGVILDSYDCKAAIDSKAAMRSSSGGWLVNSQPYEAVRPGGIGGLWLRFSACSAAIIPPVPARSAPPRSARNSRQGESNRITGRKQGQYGQIRHDEQENALHEPFL